MEAAKLGHKYEVPLRRHFLLEQGQALDGRAIAEDSSKRLKISEQRTLDKQRLGEMLRDGENEILEGDHKALIAFGNDIHCPVQLNHRQAQGNRLFLHSITTSLEQCTGLNMEL